MKGKRALPFLRKLKNVDYDVSIFESLSISTATIDVRLVEDCAIKFDKVFDLLPVVPAEEQVDLNQKWAPGTISGAICGNNKKGIIPTLKYDDDEEALPKKGFKNSTMIWIWLNDKRINVKICNANLHMTGCKKLDHAIEATRYIQQHLQLLNSQGHEVYNSYPFVSRIDNCMTNYNFTLGVAIDLQEFDIFLDRKYPLFCYSAYDPNICIDTLQLKVPHLAVTYTIHDNGRISMCTSEQNVDIAAESIKLAFESLHMILNEYQNTFNKNRRVN